MHTDERNFLIEVFADYFSVLQFLVLFTSAFCWVQLCFETTHWIPFSPFCNWINSVLRCLLTPKLSRNFTLWIISTFVVTKLFIFILERALSDSFSANNRICKTYGKLTRTWQGPFHVNIMVTDPKHVEYFLTSTSHIKKSASYDFLIPLLGYGLINSAGNVFRHVVGKIIY